MVSYDLTIDHIDDVFSYIGGVIGNAFQVIVDLQDGDDEA